jgi:hypothetical protein
MASAAFETGQVVETTATRQRMTTSRAPRWALSRSSRQHQKSQQAIIPAAHLKPYIRRL